MGSLRDTVFQFTVYLYRDVLTVKLSLILNLNSVALISSSEEFYAAGILEIQSQDSDLIRL